MHLCERKAVWVDLKMMELYNTMNAEHNFCRINKPRYNILCQDTFF